MSSWCQYEALKYVSFLHQVLAKAAKTIPVIIMGKIISRTKYEYYEYVTAGILSIDRNIQRREIGYMSSNNSQEKLKRRYQAVYIKIFFVFSTRYHISVFP
ncbi:UAA transporter family [Popillia japonica]|uniref:Adenosine 3'-phospho 5'-phosphosulfate transporter 1 n=1 Tax=Popillia japonica TaxID=7064 RepID=A0AAW1KF20_POPJA